MYLDHVGSDAIPKRENTLVFDDLYETVSHSTEMDVDSTEMWEVCALSLKQGDRGNEKEVLNQTWSSGGKLICGNLIYNNNIQKFKFLFLILR